MTALHMAAFGGNEKAIEMLLDKGADIHSKNEVCPPPAPMPCLPPYGALQWAGGLAHWIRTHTRIQTEGHCITLLGEALIMRGIRGKGGSCR